MSKIFLLFILLLFLFCAPTGWVATGCFRSHQDAAYFYAIQKGYDSACIIGLKVRVEKDNEGVHIDTLVKVRSLRKKVSP
jgi:hypothetical protein